MDRPPKEVIDEHCKIIHQWLIEGDNGEPLDIEAYLDIGGVPEALMAELGHGQRDYIYEYISPEALARYNKLMKIASMGIDKIRDKEILGAQHTSYKSMASRNPAYNKRFHRRHGR